MVLGSKRISVLTGRLALVVSVSVGAGEFSYNGLVRSELAFSTTGERTQPSDAGTPFDNENRDVNLMALRVELEGKYIVDRRLSATGRLRGWGDWTNQIDSAYDDDTDLFAGDNYPGNGFLLSTTNSNSSVFDIPELYVDWTFGDWWLRAGKQQIAWGDAIGMRILDDMISSLDVRRHGGNYDLATEEFLDERIGQIGLRGNWRIPNTRWELEGIVTDFAPTFVFPAGSAYANLPAALDVKNAVGVSNSRDKPVYGLRLKGLVLDGQGELTFAYTKRPQSVGVLRFDPADLGLLLTSGQLPLQAAHPRLDSVGGAFSYSISTDPLGRFSFFDGMITRIEAAYFLDKQFTNPAPATVIAPAGVIAPPALGPIPLPQPIPFAGTTIEEDELSIGIVLEKIHKFRPNWLATTMIFQWWHRTEADLNETHQSLQGEDDWDWLLFSVTQNLRHNEISASLSTFYDTSGGWFLQPSLRLRPRNNFQLDVFYNWFDGDADDIYGPLEQNNEISIRLGVFF